MKYFELVVSCGHVGKGRSIEIRRFFEAENLLQAYDSAKFMPRSKKKRDSVKYVKEISFNEYEIGKMTEMDNFYLNSN